MTETPETRALEALLLGLLKGKHSHLSLTYNDHASSYCSIEEYGGYEEDDWINSEEKRSAIEKNSVWTLQWYPETPVGFYRVSASSLTAIIADLLRDADDDGEV